VIRTLPLPVRNRLAETILRALHDPAARAVLGELAGGGADAWLTAEEREHAPLLRERARRAGHALKTQPLLTADATLRDALVAAATLFDAGLGFEVHELLEPYWARATGDERQALQGLIQIAVGYQHLANGNPRGAAMLLDEGSQRLVGRGPAGLDVDDFVGAVRASLDRLERSAPPRFPRHG
jgi:hypothetical protein